MKLFSNPLSKKKNKKPKFLGNIALMLISVLVFFIVAELISRAFLEKPLSWHFNSLLSLPSIMTIPLMPLVKVWAKGRPFSVLIKRHFYDCNSISKSFADKLHLKNTISDIYPDTSFLFVVLSSFLRRL